MAQGLSCQTFQGVVQEFELPGVSMPDAVRDELRPIDLEILEDGIPTSLAVREPARGRVCP
jgi:hypothetical protein